MNITNHYVIGMLAHVDAGKTTLSETIMYNLGKLRTPGRVDKGNTFLDTEPLERERGITIFSKQAILDFDDFSVTLLDTPGHTDFSAEMERTLSVLDFAILIINGPDGVQSHTRTLWRLLSAHSIPVLIFVNKTDREGFDRTHVLKQLASDLSSDCIDFTSLGTPDDEFCEQLATADEALMESYLNGEEITISDISRLFFCRKIFPVLFGSALKNEGVDKLTDMIKSLLKSDSADGSTCFRFDDTTTHNETSAGNIISEGLKHFGARVFKISRDNKEDRLTHMKVVSGSISVRDVINDEKITAIRIYDGEKFTPVQSAVRGQIIAVTGLITTYPGQGIGTVTDTASAQIIPVLSYELILPDGTNRSEALEKLMKLSDEQPELSIESDPESSFITINLMGEIQTQVLTRKISERFGYDVSFGRRRIIYKETIDNTVEGIGHFEPLRHYADIRLRMEPLPAGSGLVFDSVCSEDVLDKNWQRLVFTHLKEKTHKGVLTCSPITDMRITITSGKSHLKHTEGGDFRQATYRAVRNGLLYAKCHLLEPYYDFILEVPADYIGRAMTDLEIKKASGYTHEIRDNAGIFKGHAPVYTMSEYASDVAAYTSGLGSLTLTVAGYGPCHNEADVIAEIGYDPLHDTVNTGDSVFCSHGSSDIIPWDRVREYVK